MWLYGKLTGAWKTTKKRLKKGRNAVAKKASGLWTWTTRVLTGMGIFQVLQMFGADTMLKKAVTGKAKEDEEKTQNA